MATRRPRNDDGELQCKECEQWLPEPAFTIKRCGRSGHLYPDRTCKKCLSEKMRIRREATEERRAPNSAVSEFMSRQWV
jgi:hypothetical protein